ncbi:hypothetical protein GGR53DRAFT_466403 [Hypoxylon sp. FL1150]|nr:hypothetical protein GGR53DRAFT_466403 [Hypoxylon sp. FL1150]
MGIAIFEAHDGIGAETVAAAVILCVASTAVVGLRIYVRIKIGALGRDDYAMIMALVFFVPSCIVTILGCLAGFGAPEDVVDVLDTSGQMYRDGRKYFFIYWVTYLGCLPFIKLSICFALLRITNQKRYVVPLWIVLALSILMTGLGIVALFTQCRPISASFDPTSAKCAGGSGSRLGWIPIAISGFSVLTDWMYAAIPVFILWNLNMRTGVKASLAFILALGALASVSTIVRMPYVVQYFFQPGHSLRKTASLIVWSIVEMGIGIIAGSLPPLRPLFRRIGFGFGATRRLKLTYEDPERNNNGGGVAPSSSYSSSADANRHRGVQLGSIKTTAKPGGSLLTTCEGPCAAGRDGERGEWWDYRTLDEEEEVVAGLDDGDVAASHRKLVIVKNTQIDVRFEAADATTLGK